MVKKVSYISNLFFIFCMMYLPIAFSANDNYIPLLTILVKKYYAQETQLMQAINEKNMKYIEMTLADNFEERKGNHPINPIPRDLWISQQYEIANNKLSPRQMAVRELGDLMIVSFVLISTQEQTPKSFIVDIWKEKNNTSLLMARYTSQL
jgi:hypothetical protein